LRGARLDHLYSSDLRRTMETAQIIGAELGLAVIPDARLREISLGCWQGMLSADIKAQYPDEFRGWHESPLTTRPPDGEDIHTLAGRVLEAVSEIASRHPGGRVGIIAHELPIAVTLAHVRGVDLAQLRDLIPGTGAWQEVSWAGMWDERFRASSFDLRRIVLAGLLLCHGLPGDGGVMVSANGTAQEKILVAVGASGSVPDSTLYTLNPDGSGSATVTSVVRPGA
jgi:broad specificity phosphatase PhoE